jgi:hypothetical protein
MWRVARPQWQWQAVLLHVLHALALAMPCRRRRAVAGLSSLRCATEATVAVCAARDKTPLRATPPPFCRCRLVIAPAMPGARPLSDPTPSLEAAGAAGAMLGVKLAD